MFVFVLEVGYEHISRDFAERVVCTATNYKYNLLWLFFFLLIIFDSWDYLTLNSNKNYLIFF